ncbi:hypothetical protein KC19_VG280600 [Ceratodon purpureus]|uniref:Uncharacterized protein n=1 Tax=Ceratodon purpureus TaxID=3225 RepID=A0A8T0HV39_CERPU|nr:hypothetical protein KC19_VG280600 [Ceratodon purpureus]
MDDIDSQLLKLQAERVELQSGGRVKGKLATPSPRESSKGGRSKRPVVPEMSNEIQVCLSRGGRGWNSGLVDSSTPSLQEAHIITDRHSIGIWDTVKDVPPCEVNSVGHAIGRFWKHMQSYTHDRAPWLFEWDLNWTHQPKEVKWRFADRIKQLYPRNYDMDFVLEDVGANIRQRREN